MNPFGSRAAEDFARLLDGGRVAATGPMASYALTAGRLRTAGAALTPATTPRAEFRAALRTRLVAVAAVQAHNAATAPAAAPRAVGAALSWPSSRRAQRGLGVAAGAMASVVAVAGIAVAGSQSLPGDPFYGVKKGVEALELRTAGGDVAKGSKHLDFAAERLHEVRGLTLGRDAAFGPIAPGESGAMGGSVDQRVRDTLATMDSETRLGSALLTRAYRNDHSEAPLEILSTFAAKQSTGLRALLPDLPAGARARAEDSLALVSGVAVETSQLLAVGVCTGACAPTATAPSLDPSPALPGSTATAAPCGCDPATQPAPTTAPTPQPAGQPGQPAPGSSQPTTAPTPSPTPAPSPSSPGPLPVPTPSVPMPVPTLPVPVPSLSPSPLPTLLPAPSLPGSVLPLPSLLPTPLSTSLLNPLLPG